MTTIEIRRRPRILASSLLALLFGLFGTIGATAQGDASIESQLGLSADQKQKIAQLTAAWKQNSAPIQKKIAQLQSQRDALEKSGAQDAEIRAVLKEIADEEIKLAMLLRKFKQDYLKVLTAEQIKLLQELKKNR